MDEHFKNIFTEGELQEELVVRKFRTTTQHGAIEEKKRNEEVARQTWDSWIVDLTDQDQPDTCSIDDDDCEACGS